MNAAGRDLALVVNQAVRKGEIRGSGSRREQAGGGDTRG